MKLTLNSQYRSLYPFMSEDLPDFTIVTGKNGSGKSQLLEIINKKITNNSDASAVDIQFIPDIKKVQAEGVAKQSIVNVSSQIWKDRVGNFINIYNSLGKQRLALLNFFIKNPEIWNPEQQYNKLLSEDSTYINILLDCITSIGHGTFQKETIPIYIQGQVLQSIPFSNKKFIEVINTVSKSRKKNNDELTQNDFFLSELPDHLFDESELFESKIELIFYNYAKRRDKNATEYFEKNEYKIDNESVSDLDFVKAHSPPWLLINKLLEEYDIPFYFNEIKRKDFKADLDLEFKFLKKDLEKEIAFENLSSGEKIIIGLILKLFTSEYYEKNLTFPELILLDEPDAHLHPQMSKMLIDILGKTFVDTYGVKVIFTTHSPSTIALCPEDNIFQLTNGKHTSLKKISKDSALKLLTGFIPTLSIDYNSHRQVFVESPTDINYYQNIYNRHQQSQILTHKLYFISNGYGKGNCNQVYKIVEDIRTSGNITSFGVVDWDRKNNNSQYTYVHGHDSRYSVENYLLEPIYILILLIDTNNAHNILSEMGIDRTYNQYLLGQETESDLQNWIKLFFNKIEEKFHTCRYDNLVDVNYLNGKTLQLPQWYLLDQGHSIVEKLKAVFPGLEKYRNEGEIQLTLSNIIAKCYPFVPTDTITLLEKVSN